MKKPISYYCKNIPNGWEQIPLSVLGFPETPYFYSFLNKEEGLQFSCDVKDGYVHVSIAPIPTYKKVSEDDIVLRAEEIITQFMGNLEFQRVPDDERCPIAKHYFHYLETQATFSNN